MMKLTGQVKEHAFRLGFDLFGVSDILNPELQRAPSGHKPQDYLPTARSVISLGMRVINAILQTAPSAIYSKHYDTLNEALNSSAYKLAKHLEDLGFRSIYFPETDSYSILWKQYNEGYTTFVPCFSHMAAAVAAGLGRMGVCGVVLTPKHGPRQRWISVVTEAPLTPGHTLEGEICLERRNAKSCQKCVEACPIKAISLEEGTDVRRCWVHWTDLRDRGLACGICIKVCPVGR